VDADTQFSIIAGKVGLQGSVEVTARQLSRMVGAERRGTRIVAEIRSRLARHRLETEPDFADVWPDQRILVVPGKDHRPPYLDHLDEAARRLASNEPPLEVSVRTILEWFGVERRSAPKSEMIRATLSGFDLETRPDFDSVHVDTPVALVRTERPSEDVVNPLEPQPAAGAATGKVEHPESAQTSALSATFRIGTLVKPDRTVTRISPQATLREAMSLMLCERVSHLPVMPNERTVKGIVRWKDVGRFMLLDTEAHLDKPVERVMVQAVVVSMDLPFLAAVADIIEHGCVLVADLQNRITGIVTTKDLGGQLQHLAAPFVTLGEIERGLRVLVEQGEFTVEELRAFVQEPGDPRPIASAADLTLGQFERLLQRDEVWSRLEIPLGKRAFVERLRAVRLIRNAVMHFDPDGPSERERRELQKFLDLMYEIRRHLE
jgi:predicted transcriptional regulator